MIALMIIWIKKFLQKTGENNKNTFTFFLKKRFGLILKSCDLQLGIYLQQPKLFILLYSLNFYAKSANIYRKKSIVANLNHFYCDATSIYFNSRNITFPINITIMKIITYPTQLLKRVRVSTITKSKMFLRVSTTWGANPIFCITKLNDDIVINSFTNLFYFDMT